MNRPLLTLGAVLLLAGCARPGGFADAREGCSAQAASFNSAGDPFVRPAQPRWWMRPSLQRQRTAEVNLQAGLARENSELDSLQIAFDSLLYCRWIEARTVRADLSSGRVPRAQAEQRMTALRARLRADLDRAKAVLAELDRQASARAAALEEEAPGIVAALPRVRGTNQLRPVVAAATVPLRLRPDAGAPEVGRVAAGEGVTVRPAAGGFAAVESGGELRGYAPAGAFQIAERAPVADRPASPIRILAATNLTRRDNFAESVSLAESSAISGFELAS
jgi:hypothetical protein